VIAMLVGTITEDLSDTQRLAVVVFFIPMAMWFIGWFAPLAYEKAVDDGIAPEQDVQKSRAIGRWLRRAALIVFVLGLVGLALAA
jgi:hypothetical protein